MQNVYGRGQANGLSGLKMLSAEEVRELEPNCRAVRAIHVPETGIVDYVQVARKMAEVIQQRGGRILTGARLSSTPPPATAHPPPAPPPPPPPPSPRPALP